MSGSAYYLSPIGYGKDIVYAIWKHIGRQQSPFVTFLLYFLPNYEYAYEASIIQEEILKQRYEGIENEIGVKVPTSFPKLIYVLDEHNVHEDSKYFYLTELSAKVSAKTLMPDYISAKKMKETYEGNVFVPIKYCSLGK